ncbi:caspase family protein [Emticicia sp. BO119]|uniref:caspase family protein n=1 Tax=Emticicia sp. BO119 TaxID=2757768 RepID=UPI0015F00A42|nr:caspase family protein [Emticicia sp. BO119]MBA4852388.1 caspase family protein [Emticicia sp. BO119]
MATQKNVFALLIGIDKYKNINNLHGCVNDIDEIENYLYLNKNFNVTIQKLINNQATRKEIINGFENYLSEAKENDTILFYYSGHGTQERADSIWKEETDGLLECLVCYDETNKVSDFLLADKELRFLIAELYERTHAHIVTIFDCCHSGDNTRNGALVEASFKSVIKKIVYDKNGGPFPQRQWSEFLFSNSIKEPTSNIPQGVHVQLAACESNQTAIEIAGEGVFTKTLIKVLKGCGGNISYNVLRSRLRQYMRASFEQTPRVYIPINASKILDYGFLNISIDSKKMLAEVTKNNKNGWQLNVGAIHGLNVTSGVNIVNVEDPTKIFKAKIRENGIFIDFTLIDAEGLESDKVYKAEVLGLLTQELKLEFKNHDATLEEASKLFNELTATACGSFSFREVKGIENNEKDSGKIEVVDYTFHVRSGEVFITLPKDPYRPLIRPIPYIGQSNYDNIIGTIQHISRWHFIKNLQNTNRGKDSFDNPLEIKITQTSENTIIFPINNDFASIAYEKKGNDWSGTIKIEITNTTHKDLYFCALYLTKEFQCFLDLLPQRVQLLEAGKSISLSINGSENIELELGNVEKEYNWPKTIETLKFIISTSLFEAEALTLDELPKPFTSDDIEELTTKNFRGLKINKAIESSSWITQTLNLEFINPTYNRISAGLLNKLLQYEETVYFASRLYYEIKLDKFGQPTIWELKKGLIIPEDEKGLYDDIKIFLGNKYETAIRKNRYEKLKQDPSRLRVVAEGDSWFQYPIQLQDIVDQLYKRYAVLSLAEAGDTLENYLKKREYVKAIGDEGSKIFLVSGGGNDVLGKEFQFFLKDEPDRDDDSPKRYLTQKFFNQLEKLERLYVEMFSELISQYKDLHIFVHCYDYIIPLDTTISGNKKKTSWSGKFMIEKKIIPQTEREKLISYILDQFAEKIKSLISKNNFQDNVTLIDTRNLVGRNNWSDEIHPTNIGFELIGNKFIEEIEKIAIKKKYY